MKKTNTLSMLLLFSLLSLTACSPETRNNAEFSCVNARQPMTAAHLGELIQEIDPEAELAGNTWRFEAAGNVIAVIYDEAADRMRIMIPITETDKLTEQQKTRLLQANFDSALDARYSIAQNVLWGTFIHPLSPLTDREFLLGVGQTISVVETYGDSYSSGMFTFGAGDSAEI
ncbi:MAG: hypothetical protein AB8G18_10435 [Gammaproteobacteria bacterium]